MNIKIEIIRRICLTLYIMVFTCYYQFCCLVGDCIKKLVLRFSKEHLGGFVGFVVATTK